MFECAHSTFLTIIHAMQCSTNITRRFLVRFRERTAVKCQPARRSRRRCRPRHLCNPAPKCRPCPAAAPRCQAPAAPRCRRRCLQRLLNRGSKALFVSMQEQYVERADVDKQVKRMSHSQAPCLWLCISDTHSTASVMKSSSLDLFLLSPRFSASMANTFYIT